MALDTLDQNTVNSLPRLSDVYDADRVQVNALSINEIFSLYLSLGGCFVCMRGLLEIDTRVRVTLTRKDQDLTALAVVRVAKPQTGMGLEFLGVDADFNKILLAWIGSLRQLR
jgi:PilZ domain